MTEISSAIVADKRNIESALAYAALGWQIFPAPPDSKKSYKSEKHSGRKWGMTADPDEIRADFTRWPNARIGIPTGAVNGIIVVEIDTERGHGIDGFAAFRELETKYGLLPNTYQVQSPSGSLHNYLKHPGARFKIPNSASVIGAGVDVRGDGGMVIGAGSVNPDGGIYRVLSDAPIAPLPERWIELLKYKKATTIRERATAAVNAHRVARMVQSGGGNRYADAALRYEIDGLANTAPTSRNVALNKSAFSLFQLVHAGLLDGGDVERQLIDACSANGLIDDPGNGGLSRIMATIRSAFNAALVKPRRGLA